MVHAKEFGGRFVEAEFGGRFVEAYVNVHVEMELGNGIDPAHDEEVSSLECFLKELERLPVRSLMPPSFRLHRQDRCPNPRNHNPHTLRRSTSSSGWELFAWERVVCEGGGEVPACPRHKNLWHQPVRAIKILLLLHFYRELCMLSVNVLGEHRHQTSSSGKRRQDGYVKFKKTLLYTIPYSKC